MLSQVKNREIIDESCQFTFVMGNPILHSQSPQLHNSCFKHFGIHALYLPLQIRKEEIGKIVEKIKHSPCLGFNVTVPLKEIVLKYLDKIDNTAQIIGAVNTVSLRNGCAVGYNTDAKAYGESLKKETGFSALGKTMFIFGAGGASRACVYQMALEGMEKIVICNRTEKKGTLLAGEMSDLFSKVEFCFCPFEKNSIKKYISSSNLIVNATSIGTSPEYYDSKGNLTKEFFPLDWNNISDKVILSDLTYVRKQSPLEYFARKYNKIHQVLISDGLGMFIHQAAMSFSLWTGCEGVMEFMRSASQDIFYKKS